MKQEDEDQAAMYSQNDFLPINLTSLVIKDWSNPKLQEITRRAEVYELKKINVRSIRQCAGKELLLSTMDILIQEQ